MAKVSFRKEDAAQDVPAVVTATVVSTPSSPSVPSLPVATINASTALERPSSFIVNDEEIGLDDVILPRINIVQKVGDLSNQFTPGDIVLNRNLVIHEPANPQKKAEGTGPLKIIVLGFRPKKFVEKVAGGDKGLLLDSEQEIVAHNGTLSWREWQQSVEAQQAGGPPAKRYFQTLATAVLLIEKPASITDDISFPHEIAGKHYAMALWSMKGTAYTHGAMVLHSAVRLGRKSYPSQVWSLTTKLEAAGQNFAHVPLLKPTERTSPELLSYVQSIIG